MSFAVRFGPSGCLALALVLLAALAVFLYFYFSRMACIAGFHAWNDKTLDGIDFQSCGLCPTERYRSAVSRGQLR